MKAKCGGDPLEKICSKCGQEIEHSLDAQCDLPATHAIFMGDDEPEFFCPAHLKELKKSGDAWWINRIPLSRLRKYKGAWQIKWDTRWTPEIYGSPRESRFMDKQEERRGRLLTEEELNEVLPRLIKLKTSDIAKLNREG